MRRLIFYAAMIFVVYFLQIGVFRGKKEGCLIGFFFGILMDALFTMYFGFYALTLSVIGYMAGYVQQIFYEEDMTLPIVIIGIGDLLYNVVIYLASFLTRGRMDFFFYFRKIILPEMIYTLILAVFLYRIISWMNKKIEIKGSENRID